MINWKDRRAAKAAVCNAEDALSQAQKMLKQAGAKAGDQAEGLRAQAVASLDAARAAVGELQDRAVSMARSTDDYVRNTPWQAVGAATAIGIVLGMVVGRSLLASTDSTD